MQGIALRRSSLAYDQLPVNIGESHRGAPSQRILFISDDEQLRALLCTLLIADGHASVVGMGSPAALSSSELLTNCDVAIVDISVSPAHAMRAFLRIKKSSNAATVLIGAKIAGWANPSVATSEDVLLYKPFDPRELVLIIRAMRHRRVRSGAHNRESLSAGPITLHTLLNAATVAGREIELTGAETRVLAELLVSASNPVTRDWLMRRALGREWSPLDRCLDSHINHLRRKIGADRCGRTPIRTLRGVGYLLLAEWDPPT
jgi:DNA-binding response OmpR family regulator